jgi:hypothetical protein
MKHSLEQTSFEGNTFVSDLRPRRKSGLLAILALLLAACLAFPALAEEYRSPSDGIQSMRYEDGVLSLETRDAPLEKVLNELSRIAMITIISDGPVEGRLTLYVDRLPLDKALRKILRGKDTSFVYAAEVEASPTQYVVKEVRIYVAKAEEGEARRYSHASKEAKKTPRSSRSRKPPSRRKPSGSQSATRSPAIPNIATSEETERILSEMMAGNFDGLNEIAERLREANPEVEEQIDEFLETLEEARISAEENGEPFSPLEGLGDMRTIMHQLYRGGGLPAQRAEPE